MKNLGLLFQILFVVLMDFNGCRSPQETKIDHLFKEYTGGVPGAAVMIIRNGNVIFKRGYGLAKIQEKIPVVTHTNFRLASVTKQFTAMGIMMLVEQNTLSFDQSICDIFPDFPNYGKQITIRNLLQHTSGLVAYESLVSDTTTKQVSDNDVLAMMKAQDSTYFIPGSQYRYSNSGYAVLAMVIENVMKKSFAQYLKEHIFDPLGMINTVAYEKGIAKIKNRAHGYAKENGKFIYKDQSLYSAVLGDGGIYSSVEDLFKWDQALYTDKLIEIKTLNQAFIPAVLTNGDSLDYGFGWRIDDYMGHRRLHHTGSTSGFRNVIQRFPDEKFTVIILTNRAEPDVAKLAEQLTDLFL